MGLGEINLNDGKFTAAEGLAGIGTAGIVPLVAALNKNPGPGYTAKQMLRNDVKLLQNNPSQLGLNKSEIGAQMRDAQSQAAAQSNAAASQMSQAALAGQGFQAGAMQQSARGLGQAAANAGAQAGAQAHEASRKMIERETGRIRGELESQWGKKREDAQMWADMTMKTIPMIQEIATKAATGGATAAV